MNDKLAREILSMHADVLSTGIDVTETLARRYPDIAPLLTLAQTLQAKMEMKEVSAEFVQHLYQELMGATVPTTAAATATQRQTPGWMMGAAAVGSAVTGIAAVVLARRASSARSEAMGA